MANRLADLLSVYRVVNFASTAAGDPVVCAGLADRNGAQPDRGLASQTPRPALRRRDIADACTHHAGYHDHRVCDSAVDQPDAGIVAERTQTRAGPSNPDRIAHAKLSGSSRSIAP